MTYRKSMWHLAILICAWLGPATKSLCEPGPKPEMIGPGVISTEDDELGGSITADGKTLYFEKSAPPHYLYMMFESHMKDGKWQTPSVLPFSGRYKDTDPVLSPDEQTMLFASDRPVEGVDRHHFYIWSVRRKKHGWGEPELLPGPVNDGFNQVFCSMARNGNLYFTSSRKSGHYDVFRSRLVNGKYQRAEDLGPEINGPNVDTFEALIAPDESYLLMGSFGRDDSLGSSDLYVSYYVKGKFSKPINLGPAVNSPARDYSPRISGDGKWLLFTSERLDTKPELPMTYEGMTRFSRGLYNGLGNLYRIELDPVLAATRK